MGISFNVFAQDVNSIGAKRFSSCVAVNYRPDGSGFGGAFGFGFLLFHNEKWDIRNHTFINAFHIYDDDGVVNTINNFNEKISVGGITQNRLSRYYGFIEGGLDEYILDTQWVFMPKIAIGARVYFKGLFV
jgi:hypothetical protein